MLDEGLRNCPETRRGTLRLASRQSGVNGSYRDALGVPIMQLGDEVIIEICLAVDKTVDCRCVTYRAQASDKIAVDRAQGAEKGALIFSLCNFEPFRPADLIRLCGARLVATQEIKLGQWGEHWAKAKIETLTGGDPISAGSCGRTSSPSSHGPTELNFDWREGAGQVNGRRKKGRVTALIGIDMAASVSPVMADPGPVEPRAEGLRQK
jgi:hypothetical protein